MLTRVGVVARMPSAVPRENADPLQPARPTEARRVRVQRAAAWACVVVLLGPKILGVTAMLGTGERTSLGSIPWLLVEVVAWGYALAGSERARLLLGIYYGLGTLVWSAILAFGASELGVGGFALGLAAMLVPAYCAWFLLLGPPLGHAAADAHVPTLASLVRPSPAAAPRAPRRGAALAAKAALVVVAVWLVGVLGMWLVTFVYFAG